MVKLADTYVPDELVEGETIMLTGLALITSGSGTSNVGKGEAKE
jgi:hypothetical protein